MSPAATPEARGTVDARVVPMRRLAATIIGAALLGAPTLASGQSPATVRRAQSLKKSAFEHFAAGRYAPGIAALEEGYDLVPHPDFLLNVAIAYERWDGHCLAAVEAYRRFLGVCGDCRNHAMAARKLEQVREGCRGAPTRTKKFKHEVEGAARMTANRMAAARRTALGDARKKAVLKAVDLQVEALLAEGAAMALIDDRARFERNAHLRVLARSDGYVLGDETIKEWRDGQTFRMLVAVEVDAEAVERELSMLARQIAGARFPKVMFLVQEEYQDRGGAAHAIAEPVLQAVLEDALLSRGFEVVAKAHVDRLREQEAEVFAEVVTDPSRASQLAMSYRAEYVVTAVARIKHTSFDDFGLKDHHAHVELSLKAINASTGGVVASTNQAGGSPANCYSEQDLRIRSVRAMAPKLVDGLIRRLGESWERETANGVRYAVKLYNTASFRVQGRAFIEMMSRVPGVRSVKKLSYGGKRLELEVFYAASRDAAELEAAILRAAAESEALKTLDVTYSRGRELSFEL